MNPDWKKVLERRIGDKFVAWYNESNGTSFAFERQDNDPPDVEYRDGDRLLPIEVTVAYCDSRFAQVDWQTVRPSPEGLRSAATYDFEGKLARSIRAAIENKCLMDLPPNTVIVVYARAPLAQADFQSLLPQIDVHIPQGRIVYVGGCRYDHSSSGEVWWWSRL